MTYFANGTEGMRLDRQCESCVLGGSPCIVYSMQFEYNYDQLGNELAEKIMNHFIKGGICQMKILLDKENLVIKQQSNEPDNQMDLQL